MPPVMSSDAAGVPWLGVVGVLTVGHRRPALRQALDLLGQIEVDVAIEDHIDPVTQVAGAHVLVTQVGIRHVALVESIAHPADRVGIGPRDPDTEAGGRRRMSGHLGCRGGAREIEPELLHHRPGRVAQPLLRRQDPRAGGKPGAVQPEGALGDLDPEGRETVARREETLLSRIGKEQHRTVAVHAPLRPGRPGQRRERGGAHGGIGGRHHLEVVVRRQGPGDVIVRLAAVLREALRCQQIDRVVAIRLVETHDVGPRRKPALSQDERGGRAPDLDLLVEQAPDHLRHPRAVALIVGDDEPERWLIAPLAPRVPPLLVEVAQHLWGVPRHLVERRQQTCLGVIQVVARRPGELRRRRERAIPLHGRVDGLDDPAHRLGGGVPPRLVAAAEAVVVHGDRIEVVVAERLAEVPGPHPGHAEGGHGAHLVEAHLEELAVRDRIDVRVVGPGAVPGHQERHRLMQVVDDRRVPFVEHPVHRPGRLVGLLVRIAVDVDEGVLRPVGRRLARQGAVVGLPLQVAVEPLDHLVAPVGVRNRVEQHHRRRADAPDHRLVGDGKTVRQLDERLGRAGFVGVQDGVDVVDRTGRGDQPLGRRRVGAPRVGQRGGRPLQAIEVADALLVGHHRHQDLAPLFAAADGEHPHARAGGGERAQVGVRLRRVGQLTGCAGDPAEKVTGRRDTRCIGQIRNPGREEPRLGRGGGDRLDRAGLDGVGAGVDSARGAGRHEGGGDNRRQGH